MLDMALRALSSMHDTSSTLLAGPCMLEACTAGGLQGADARRPACGMQVSPPPEPVTPSPPVQPSPSPAVPSPAPGAQLDDDIQLALGR